METMLDMTRNAFPGRKPAGLAHHPRALRRSASGEADSALRALEAGFSTGTSTQVSFLINAFYLVGEHRVLEWLPEGNEVADELVRLGHRVAAPGAARGARGTRAGGGGPRGGGFDRAMFLSRAFGHLGEAENAAWLKAMYRALRPGGLLLFHVIDRDRAWQLVDRIGAEGGARLEAGFDPGSGRVSVRAHAEGPQASPSQVSAQAYNLAEIRGLLGAAGFALERAYGDWEGGNVAEGGAATGRMIIVAAKPRRRVTRKLLQPGFPAGRGKGGGP
jgi:hypothetical protein